MLRECQVAVGVKLWGIAREEVLQLFQPLVPRVFLAVCEHDNRLFLRPVIPKVPRQYWERRGIISVLGHLVPVAGRPMIVRYFEWVELVESVVRMGCLAGAAWAV